MIRHTLSAGSEAELVAEISRPVPQQFDKFVPWMCTQYEVVKPAVVIRLLQEDYVAKKPVSAKLPRRLRRRNTLIHQIEDFKLLASSSTGSGKLSPVIDENVVPVKAYYNKKNQLVEVSIAKCFKPISDVIIKAICSCLPVHSALNRLTFRNAGLTFKSVCEISKALPYSSISEICFDDTVIPEGNQYIVLEQVSQLRYLSLNRCRINDVICKKIAANMDYGTPAANTLRILELSTNEITDEGVRWLGFSLKRNRTLLHLNLSGNKITDDGFASVIDALKEFPLTWDESYELKFKKMKYLQKKLPVYEQCLKELHKRSMREVRDDLSAASSHSISHVQSHTRLAIRRFVRKKKSQMNLAYIRTQAQHMARRIVGELNTPYAEETLVVKDDVYYCRGNMILCSLNVAYNEMDLRSLRRILETLTYQSELEMVPPETGLIRISVVGNYLPSNCPELDDIEYYLKKVLDSRSPRRVRGSSGSQQKHLT